MRFATADGGWRWMAVSGRLVLGPDGEPLADIAAMRDIQAQVDARTQVVAAGIELEEAYSLLAENSTGVVFRGDNDGVLRWVSDSVVSLLGWAPEDMQGLHFRDFVHPDDASVARAAHDAVMRGDADTIRFRLREKSGEYRWIEGRVRPVRDAAGAVVGRVGGWRDIEGEVAALEALAQSEAVLRTALRSAAIGMALTDEHGAFTLVNPALATMLGRDEEWLLRHRVDDVVGGEHDTLVDSVRDGLTSGRVDKFEGNLPPAQGGRAAAVGARRGGEGRHRRRQPRRS